MQSTCRSDLLHGLYVSEGWRSVGFSRLLEALAAREEQCKQVGQERNAQQVLLKQTTADLWALCPPLHMLWSTEPPLPSLPVAILTIWARSVPAPVWYPLPHQFFSSSRPGQRQNREEARMSSKQAKSPPA